MNQVNVLLGYDPRCTFYPKATPNGVVYYYLRYYLPGNIRVSRSVGQNKKEAKRLMFEKNQSLKEGVFDDFDFQRIPESIKDHLRKPKIMLNDALERYMRATSYNRRPNTNRDTYLVLEKLIGMIPCQFIDEVKSEDVQVLAGLLKAQGLSPASVLSYLSLLNSFFNWLIEDAEVLEGRNPVSKVKKPPRSSKVRDFLIDHQTVNKLFEVDELPGRKGIPIIPLFQFLVTTGARLGEVIHAEWQDFDLNEGVWNIFPKPNCPTLDGLGWYPKWKKPRTIQLLPQALRVLRSLPVKEETWGLMNLGNDAVWKKANFVFTIRKKVEIDGLVSHRDLRINSTKRAWFKLLNQAGVLPFQIKDLRTYFNWVLVSQLGLSNKEAGAYLGNSEAVNNQHYTPVNLEAMSVKLRLNGPEMMIPQIAT